MSLNDRIIVNLKTTGKQYRKADGGGLVINVSPAGGKLWRLAYRFGGKQKMLSLGAYPDVTLKMARERRDAAKELLAKGISRRGKAGGEKAGKNGCREHVSECGTVSTVKTA